MKTAMVRVNHDDVMDCIKDCSSLFEAHSARILNRLSKAKGLVSRVECIDGSSGEMFNNGDEVLVTVESGDQRVILQFTATVNEEYIGSLFAAEGSFYEVVYGSKNLLW